MHIHNRPTIRFDEVVVGEDFWGDSLDELDSGSAFELYTKVSSNTAYYETHDLKIVRPLCYFNPGDLVQVEREV